MAKGKGKGKGKGKTAARRTGKGKGPQPKIRTHMKEGAKDFGCYVKRVKVRGGGTTTRGYCRNLAA